MDFWIANLSDGSVVQEEWLDGYMSPWIRLMQYCKTNKCYLTALRFILGENSFSLPNNAIGYWQVHAMHGTQAVVTDPELDIQRGIGYVKDGIVNILWVIRDRQTKELCFWKEQRSAIDQNQIIWSK